jgi:hypothetical protein
MREGVSRTTVGLDADARENQIDRDCTNDNP